MELTKGQNRKREAFLKSVGGDEAAAGAMFKIWMDANVNAVKEDKTATAIETAMAGIPADDVGKLKFGNRGYTIKKAKGKGKSGFVATKND